MGRLKAATLIETMAALVILTFIIGIGYFLIGQLSKSNKGHLYFKAEKHLESEMLEGLENREWELDGLDYRITLNRNEAPLIKIIGQVEDGQRVILERRRWQIEEH